MTQTEANAHALKNWLQANPGFTGTVSDMAFHLGLVPWDVNNALYWCRLPHVAKANGWYIPKQPRGNSYDKDWRVIDLATGNITLDEQVAGDDSDRRVKMETVNILTKMIVGIDLRLAKTRSPVKRQTLTSIRRTLDGANAMIESSV